MNKLEEIKRLLGEARTLYRDALDMPVFDEATMERAEEYFQRAGVKMISALAEIEEIELSYAALEASRDFMEREMEFYKDLYRDSPGYIRRPPVEEPEKGGPVCCDRAMEPNGEGWICCVCGACRGGI